MTIAERRQTSLLEVSYHWISGCWATARAGEGKGDRKGKGEGKGKKGESNKGEKGKDEERKGKGTEAKKHFDGYCLHCKAWCHMKEGCLWDESVKTGREASSMKASAVSAASTTSEPPITGICYSPMKQRLRCLTLHSGCIRGRGRNLFAMEIS